MAFIAKNETTQYCMTASRPCPLNKATRGELTQDRFPSKLSSSLLDIAFSLVGLDFFEWL